VGAKPCKGTGGTGFGGAASGSGSGGSGFGCTRRPQVQIEACVLVMLAGQLGWRTDIVLLPRNAAVLFCAQRAIAFLDTTSYFLPVGFALAW
jgi:hypothetical protein